MATTDGVSAHISAYTREGARPQQQQQEGGDRERTWTMVGTRRSVSRSRQLSHAIKEDGDDGETASSMHIAADDVVSDLASASAAAPRRSSRNRNSIRLSGGFCPSFYRNLNTLFFDAQQSADDEADPQRGRPRDGKAVSSSFHTECSSPRTSARRRSPKRRLEHGHGRDHSHDSDRDRDIPNNQRQQGQQQPPKKLVEEASSILPSLASLDVRKVHADPAIYVIDNFLTPSELEFFDHAILGCTFQQSFVDNMNHSGGEDSGDGIDNDTANDGERRNVSRSGDAASMGTAEEDIEAAPSLHSECSQSSTDASACADSQRHANANATAHRPSPKKQRCRSRRRQQGRTLVDKSHRTSTFFAFGKLHNRRVASLEQRIASMLGCWVHQIEALQLVRYKPGQFFGLHHDMGNLLEDGTVALPAKDLNVKRRLVTLFIYLNTLAPEQGGCTYFPNCASDAAATKRGVNDKPTQRHEKAQHSEDFESMPSHALLPSRTSTRLKERRRKQRQIEKLKSEKRKQSDNARLQMRKQPPGLRVHPKRGRAVLWSNVTQDGKPDPRTIHAGEPVIEAKITTRNHSGTADTKEKLDGCPKLPNHGESKPQLDARRAAETESIAIETGTAIKYGLNIWICEE